MTSTAFTHLLDTTGDIDDLGHTVTPKKKHDDEWTFKWPASQAVLQALIAAAAVLVFGVVIADWIGKFFDPVTSGHLRGAWVALVVALPVVRYGGKMCVLLLRAFDLQEKAIGKLRQTNEFWRKYLPTIDDHHERHHEAAAEILAEVAAMAEPIKALAELVPKLAA
jgi:hypothetical protein